MDLVMLETAEGFVLEMRMVWRGMGRMVEGRDT